MILLSESIINEFTIGKNCNILEMLLLNEYTGDCYSDHCHYAYPMNLFSTCDPIYFSNFILTQAHILGLSNKIPVH